MKKANVMLFTVFAAFACLITGFFIGRNSVSGDILISYNHSVQEQAVATQPNESDDYGLININTASASVLQSLPNIGETLAQRIVEYRKENGDFIAIEDLLQVKGIGETRLEQIRQYITVGG